MVASACGTEVCRQVVIDRETRFRRSSRRATWLGKTSLTSWSKSSGSPPENMLARRAGCTETCSSGSREARRSNPAFTASVVSRSESEVIPAFYPISIIGEEGDRDIPRLAEASEAVMVQRG